MLTLLADVLRCSWSSKHPRDSFHISPSDSFTCHLHTPDPQNKATSIHTSNFGRPGPTSKNILSMSLPGGGSQIRHLVRPPCAASWKTKSIEVRIRSRIKILGSMTLHVIVSCVLRTYACAKPCTFKGYALLPALAVSFKCHAPGYDATNSPPPGTQS